MTKPIHTLKTAAIGLLLFVSGTAFSADELPGLGVQEDAYFYTGKPYDADAESYAFMFRNYDPEIDRWMSSDPAGFPDGPNAQLYAPTPTAGLDPLGLKHVPNFDVAAFEKPWSLVDFGLDASGSNMSQIVHGFDAAWEADVYVACVEEGTTKPVVGFSTTETKRFDVSVSLGSPLNEEFGIASPGEGPLTIPSPTTLLGAIGELLAAGADATIPDLNFMPRKGVNTIYRELSSNAPTKPTQGVWTQQPRCE